MSDARTIKIFADAASADSPIDASTGGAVAFRRGGDLVVEALFLENGRVADLSGAVSAVLEILDVGAVNSPAPRTPVLLARCEVSEFSEPETAAGEAPSESSGRHARFGFTGLQTRIAPGEKWMSVYVEFGGGKRVFFSSGWIYVGENYLSEPGVEPLENPVYLKKSEAVETYAARSANLSDLQSASAARSNLEVYSMRECDAAINASVAGSHNHDSQYSRLGHFHAQYADKSKSLSDIADKSLARSNLGVYSKSETDAGLASANSEISAAKVRIGACEDACASVDSRVSGHGGILMERSGAGRYWLLGGSLSASGDIPEFSSLSVFATVSAGYSGPVWNLGQSALSVSGGGAAFAGTSAPLDAARPHAFAAVFDGSIARLFVDGDMKIEAPSAVPHGAFAAGGDGASGAVSRIKAFNFDCSAPGSAYTLSDYVSGLDESPLLRQCPPGKYFENNLEKFPHVSSWNNGSAVYDGDEIVVSGFNTDAWVPLACTFPQPIRAGSRVRVKFRVNSADAGATGTSLYETSAKRTTIVLHAPDNSDFEWEGVCGYNATFLFFQIGARAWTEARFSVSNLSVEVLGPALSDSGSADGSVVRDLSAAKNHMLLRGAALASKSNTPALCPHTVSWAGTATAQNVCGETGAEADSRISVWARATSNVAISVKCAANAAVQKDLAAGVWTECGTWLNSSKGAITATPAAAYEGAVDFSVKIERLK